MKKNETILMYHENQSASRFGTAWSYVDSREFITNRSTFCDDMKYIGITTFDLADKFIKEVHKAYEKKYPMKGVARPSAEEILTLWVQFNINHNLLY